MNRMNIFVTKGFDTTMTKVSVITPSYNQANFIERTIQSVLSQNIPRLEYVVMDGGSKDHTVDILKKYESQLQWRSEKDNGQAHAVNKGFQQTTGDIIGWLNSDDVYYPDAIKRVCEFFDSNPDIDVIYGNAYHIDIDDNIIETYYTEEWDINILKEVCYLCQPAVFFRRKVITQCGMLNDKLQYCMDYEFWLRLAKNGIRFAFIKDFLAGSRLHADTKTLGSRVKVHAEINDMLKTMYRIVPDRWLSNYAHAYVESTYPKNYSPHKLRRALAIKTFTSSLLWNKKISLPLFVTTARWFMSSLHKRNG